MPESKDASPPPGISPELAASLVPALPESTLKKVAEGLGVSRDGFRPGRVPAEFLRVELAKAVRSDPEARKVVLGALGAETGELSRRISGRPLAAVVEMLPGLIREFPPLLVGTALILDPRAWPKHIAKLLPLMAAVPPSSTARAPDESARGARVGGKYGGQGASGRTAAAKRQARENAKLRVDLQAERRRTAEAEKKLKKAGLEAARLAKRASALEKELAAVREAGLDAASRAAPRQASEQCLAPAIGQCLPGAGRARPDVLERPAAAEWEERLERARRENDRLESEKNRLEKEVARLELSLGRERARVDGLRAVVEKRPSVAAETEGFRVVAAFTYEGPGGSVPLAQRYSVTIPSKVVRHEDLLDGDIVAVKVVPSGRVELEVVDRTPRREVLGYVHRVETAGKPAGSAGPGQSAAEPTGAALPAQPAAAWKVLAYTGSSGMAVAWISDDEARAWGLEHGDPVTVLVPGRRQCGGASGGVSGGASGGVSGGVSGGAPAGASADSRLWTPSPGLPALPRAKVAKRHDAGAMVERRSVVGPEGVSGGRAFRRRAAKLRRVGRLGAGPPDHASPRAPGLAGSRPAAPRPAATLPPYLDGLRILVAGGDSYHVNYRRVIEALGGSPDFQSGHKNQGQARARARAADIVVLATRDLSHKVQGLVMAEFEGREDKVVYLDTRGQGGLVQALRPHFRTRRPAGLTESRPKGGPNRHPAHQ